MRPVSIIDYAAITALGDDVPRTVASLRCGQDGFVELPFLGSSERPLKAAPIRGYAEGLTGIDRYLALAIYALEPLFDRIPAGDRGAVALVVGLPRPERPGVPAKLAVAVREGLARRFGLDRSRVLTEERGRSSVFAGLMRAGVLDEAQPYPIVGGVDVLTNANSLRALSERGELQEEWDGYLPGEAAAFVRLAHHARRGYWGVGRSQITGLGAATEAADGSKEAPLVGVGMNRALRAAAAAASIRDGDVGLRINDINGARPAFEDDGMATARFYRSPRDQVLDVWHLGSYLGETGAAAGAIELIWAASMGELGLVAPAPIMLTCADGPDRCALVLTPPASAEGISRAVVSRQRIELHAGPVVEPTRVADPGMALTSVDDPRRELALMDLDTLDALVLVRDGHLRDPFAPWREIAAFEARLLAGVDALAWTRDRAAELALDRLGDDELDVEELASAILTLGSGELQDREWEAIHAQLRGADEARADVAARHLALCPARRLLPLMAGSLDATAGAIESAALLRALAWRGGLSDEQLALFAAADRVELVGVLLELVAFTGRASALGPIDALCRRHLDALELDALAPLLLAEPALPYFPASRYLAEAPFVAALAAIRTNSSLFAQLSAQTTPTPALVEALGWSGEAAAIPWLVHVLETGDDELAPAAAFALNLISGADLYEEVELPPDDDDDDDDDDTAPGEPVTAQMLCVDVQTWRTALASLGAPSQGRLRHGQPWSAAAPLAHLAREQPACAERTLACWQHAVITGGGFPVDPRQLVTVQDFQLAHHHRRAPRP